MAGFSINARASIYRINNLKCPQGEFSGGLPNGRGEFFYGNGDKALDKYVGDFVDGAVSEICLAEETQVSFITYFTVLGERQVLLCEW